MYPYFIRMKHLSIQPVEDSAERSSALDSSSGVVRMWVRIPAWPVAALVSLSKTLTCNHNCFVLRMGRKAVGPVCCVMHVKEPRTLIVKEKGLPPVFLDSHLEHPAGWICACYKSSVLLLLLENRENAIILFVFIPSWTLLSSDDRNSFFGNDSTHSTKMIELETQTYMYIIKGCFIPSSTLHLQFFFGTNYYSIEWISHGVTASCLYFT